jgi:OmpA-OmpF porin, OOP family
MMKKATFATVAFLLAAPSVGMAQSTMDSMKSAVTGPDSGWLAGASFGQSKFNIDCGGSSCDDTDTAFRIFGGYQFNKHFSAELGYADLGKLTVSGVASGLSANADLKATVWDLMAVGTLPVADKFSLYGKLGMYRADTKLSGSVAGFGSGSASDNNTDLTYAVGAGYDFNKNLGLRAEWQRYSKVGSDSTGGDGDIDVYGVAVVYRFK